MTPSTSGNAGIGEELFFSRLPQFLLEFQSPSRCLFRRFLLRPDAVIRGSGPRVGLKTHKRRSILGLRDLMQKDLEFAGAFFFPFCSFASRSLSVVFLIFCSVLRITSHWLGSIFYLLDRLRSLQLDIQLGKN